MGRFVIVAYRPLPDCDDALRALLAEHVPTLRARGLATDFPPVILRTDEGVYVEVFEWQSQAAIDEAHQNEAVLALWQRFDQVCRYVPLAELPESQAPFAHFNRVEPLG